MVLFHDNFGLGSCFAAPRCAEIRADFFFDLFCCMRRRMQHRLGNLHARFRYP